MNFKEYLDMIKQFDAFLSEALDPVIRRNRKKMINNFLKLFYYSPWNAEHSSEVTRIARDFGKYLNLDAEKIAKAALTHDVGKTKIPKKILHKPGKLDVEERDIMNTHASASDPMLQHLTGEHGVLARLGAKFHHTTSNEIDSLVSSGELTDDEANIAKILTISDIFEALYSEKRPYKEAMTKYDALMLMQSISVVDKNILEKFITWQYSHFANEYRMPYVEKERTRLAKKYAKT